MAFTVDPSSYTFGEGLKSGVIGKRVLITGAGKDGGIGQAFALAAGLNGAESVAVHFHRSFEDGFDLVEVLRDKGVNAFPVQADVTNMQDLWAIRSYVIEQMGGKPPNLVICNSGLTEQGYSFGRALREVDGEGTAMRRARVRQHFIENLEESRLVLDTKIDGFLALTHLWAGEAVYHKEPLQMIYISSRQAIDPGASVPGYALANFAVLLLPRLLEVNLGKASEFVSSFCLMFPFIRTGMTDEYADNERVFGRWQPRMLETTEAAQAFLQLIARPTEELSGGMFELMVDPAEAEQVAVTWQQVKLNADEHALDWSADAPLIY